MTLWAVTEVADGTNKTFWPTRRGDSEVGVGTEAHKISRSVSYIAGAKQ